MLMYFSDPSKCSCCQNNGRHDEYLVAGKCHRCEARAIMDACITANLRRNNVKLALSQMWMIGIQ